MRSWMAGLVTAMVATACGGSSANGPDAAAYAALAQNVSTGAASYETAAAATTDVPSCQSVHAAYDAQVRPMLQRMQGMSGDMDREMSMMGHTTDADMTCGADAMMAELNAHAAAACTSSSMLDNHSEATRHSAAMETWAAHQHARADETGSMMGMAGMGGSGTATMTCQRNADGTFTLKP